jgi:hypothetical protein
MGGISHAMEARKEAPLLKHKKSEPPVIPARKQEN